MGAKAGKGAVIGTLVGIGLAPFTGGLSLGLGAAVGGGIGASIGAGLDAKKMLSGTAATPQNYTPPASAAPPPELAAPTPADPDAQQAASDALQRARKYKGRAATILSGTVGDDNKAAKQLLGG